MAALQRMLLGCVLWVVKVVDHLGSTVQCPPDTGDQSVEKHGYHEPESLVTVESFPAGFQPILEDPCKLRGRLYRRLLIPKVAYSVVLLYSDGGGVRQMEAIASYCCTHL